MDPTAAPPLAFPVFVQGLALSFGLIVAIGAQNAFVLRQGLRREHVGGVVLFCAAADAALIAAGVSGMAQALGQSPDLARIFHELRVGGLVLRRVVIGTRCPAARAVAVRRRGADELHERPAHDGLWYQGAERRFGVRPGRAYRVLRAGGTASQLGHRRPSCPGGASEGWGRSIGRHQRLAD
jgi:hypothetical protein